MSTQTGVNRGFRIRSPRYTLAIPAYIWLLLFFVIPLSVIVYYSFGYKPGLFTLKPGQSLSIATDKLSLDQYRSVFSSAFFSTFKNTLRISITATIACLIIGFPFAYWLAVKVPERWRGLMLVLVLVPFWTNFLIRTIGWDILLAPEGFLSHQLQTWGLIHTPLSILNTRSAVQLGVIYNYLVLMILPLFVVLDRLDPTLREVSKDLGANRIRTFFQVTLPLSMPGVVAGMLLVFIPLTGDYITAQVLGGAKGLMAGNLVADEFSTAENWALGSAMSVVLMLIILATVIFFTIIFFVIGRLLRYRRRVDLPAVGAMA